MFPERLHFDAATNNRRLFYAPAPSRTMPREGQAGEAEPVSEAFRRHARLRWRGSPAGSALVARGGPAGFTLIESLVALLLLSVGLLGLAMLFPLGLRLGSQGQVNSGATQAAQREMEQIREGVFSPSGSFIDVDGNTLDASCSGAPGTGCGNPLTANGTIDYSLPPAVGYSGGVHDSTGQLYSVRWNVTVTVNDGRKIVLESEPVNPAAGLPIPVHLETLVAR